MFTTICSVYKLCEQPLVHVGPKQFLSIVLDICLEHLKCLILCEQFYFYNN